MNYINNLQEIVPDIEENNVDLNVNKIHQNQMGLKNKNQLKITSLLKKALLKSFLYQSCRLRYKVLS